MITIEAEKKGTRTDTTQITTRTNGDPTTRRAEAKLQIGTMAARKGITMRTRDEMMTGGTTAAATGIETAAVAAAEIGTERAVRSSTMPTR